MIMVKFSEKPSGNINTPFFKQTTNQKMMLEKYKSRIKKYIKLNLFYRRHKEELSLSKKNYLKLAKQSKTHRNNESSVFRGHPIFYSSPFWFLHSLEEIFIQQVYKFSSDKEHPLIIDCGANIGLSVLYFKKICPHSKIIAFEPDPNVFNQLKLNLSEYNYNANEVELINAAVWNTETKLSFQSEGSLGGKIGNQNFDNSIEVTTVRLKDYLINKVEFLKIDIEGAEYEVIKDCVDELKNVENLFIEYHLLPDEPQHLHEILHWVTQEGFRYYIREAWNNMTYPYMKRYNDLYQMQLNIFCFR